MPASATLTTSDIENKASHQGESSSYTVGGGLDQGLPVLSGAGIGEDKGTLFGVPYEAGSWQDKLIESFAGTHDMIGGKLSGLYDEDGNIRRDMTDAERGFYDNVVTTTAILPSVPFAAAELLSPELWRAISVMLKGAQ